MAIRWFCLQETFRSQLPPENLHLNHRLTGFEQTSEGVTLCFKNNERTTVDLLIGADGIRSAVRKQLLGVDAPPYSGWMTWRGVLKYQHRLLPPNQVTGFGGKGKIFILFDNGDGYIAWSLEMLSDRCDRSNTAQETKARVLQELEGWHPVVQEVLGLTEADIIVERPVHQPVMLSQWSGDRVTLVGDAAHAMGPHMGQSTNTAFEDVRALSVCLAQVALSQRGNLQEALAAYEKGRIERTIIVQHRTLFSAARMFKPFLKAKKFQSYLGPLPEQAKLGEKAFSDWLYGYDLPA